MPPTRRSRTSGGPASKGSQKTLSFANTKSASTLSSKDPKDKVSIPALAPTTVDVGHVSSEAAVTQQAAVEISVLKSVRSTEEEQASKVTDTQIKKYWKEREKERRTPRVHQEGLDVEEKILRLFDMSSQFGVCLFHSHQ
jgi:DNA polymerase delta subunit 4